MPRPLARFPLQSIVDSLPHLHRRRIGDERLYHSQTRTGSTGQNVLWNGALSNAMLLQRRIVKALQLGKRGEAANLLVSLGQGNDLRGADDFVHVLEYCARSPDPLFVMEAWRVMNEKDVSLNSSCSSLMVKALCRGGYLEEALNLIIYLKESHGCYSKLLVYNTFLNACVEKQNMVYANRCLELMEQQKVGKNEVTYAYLLKLALWQKNQPKKTRSVVHELWKDCIKHYSPSILTLRKFVWSYGHLGDLKSACKTLQYMVALVVRGKTSITNSIERPLYSSRLDIPIPLNCEFGQKKVNLKENEQSVPSRYCENLDAHVVSANRCTRSGLGVGESVDRFFLVQSFNDLIDACAKLQNGGLAEQLVQQMHKLGFNISSSTYDGLIRALVPDRGFSPGVEILKSMQQRNLKPYDRTLEILSISCCWALELDLAETLLDQISIHSNPNAFNAFLTAYRITDRPELAVRMLAKMKHLQVRPNILTYELLFSLLGMGNVPYEKGNKLSQVVAAKRIKALEIDMASYGIQHSPMSMKNLLKSLGAEGMIRELLHYLHVAEDLFYRKNMYLGARVYNAVLNLLVESEEGPMVVKIFKSMKPHGVLVDDATYTIMIKYCRVLKCYRSACALVSMMLRDGFYPKTVTYTSLIHILLEEKNIGTALDLLFQASSEGNELDTKIFNPILQKAGEEGLIDVVEFLVGWMQQEKIEPDSTTCSAVFTAYASFGFHSTAVEALQVLCMRIICNKYGSFPEKTRFEDNYIFAEDEGAESRIIKHHFKDFEENIAFALLNLRWCAMLGFPVSWLPDQSPWVKRLSTNYTSRQGRPEGRATSAHAQGHS